MEEIWRGIEGYENYEVSNLGNVRILDRYDYNGKFKSEQMCKLTSTKFGHLIVCLRQNNIPKTFSVHRLVAKAFPEHCGEWFEDCEVHHINNIPYDNRANNLVCLTKIEHHQIHRPPKPDRWARWRFEHNL